MKISGVDTGGLLSETASLLWTKPIYVNAKQTDVVSQDWLATPNRSKADCVENRHQCDHGDNVLIRLFSCLGPDQENIKAPRHWPLWGEFTGDQWIPRTKG